MNLQNSVTSADSVAVQKLSKDDGPTESHKKGLAVVPARAT